MSKRCTVGQGKKQIIAQKSWTIDLKIRKKPETELYLVNNDW